MSKYGIHLILGPQHVLCAAQTYWGKPPLLQRANDLKSEQWMKQKREEAARDLSTSLS